MDSASIWIDTLGFWIGLLVTLLILSAALGDHALARLGQHLLVGAALGYAAVLALHHVLRPRLWTPLVGGSPGVVETWIPLGLGLLLVLAGLDRTWRAPRAARVPLWRRGLHGAGRVPVAFLLGVGLAAGTFGALQGTFLPQFWRAARIAFDPTASGPLFVIGVLTLLVTTATLLYFYVDPARYLADQPGWIQQLVQGWIGAGRYAVWLVAGMIFARLMAARLSLLIGRVEYLRLALFDTTLWQWAQSAWQALLR
jgi:hypothetical protein